MQYTAFECDKFRVGSSGARAVAVIVGMVLLFIALCVGAVSAPNRETIARGIGTGTGASL